MFCCSGQGNDEEALDADPEWEFYEEMSFLGEVLEAADNALTIPDEPNDIESQLDNHTGEDLVEGVIVESNGGKLAFGDELVDVPKIGQTKKRASNPTEARPRKRIKTDPVNELIEADQKFFETMGKMMNSSDEGKLIQAKLQSLDELISTKTDLISAEIGNLTELLGQTANPHFNFAMTMMNNLSSIKSKKKLAILQSKILALIAEEFSDEED